MLNQNGQIQNGTSTTCLQIRKAKYMMLLYLMKRDYLKTQFQDHKGNTKHLYKLMAKLTGGVSVNPLLDSNSDVELANDFTNFSGTK